MSANIDERIVEMRFDNKQFEQGVSTTMSTLDKFKKALSLEGSAKAAQSEFDSYKSGFISLRDSINKMWSTWEYELAYKMKNIIQNTLGAFTTGAIKAGFSEYETQIGAIQTILSNTKAKGTTLDDVNSALDELNAYADKTIYNFTEMTRNIGTFTAAGVDLDTSVSAIKGIANLAAVSGSTSQQASTAMYQLSQALASGTVKLMDWNSVVNAGMGGQVFQDALKETARVHGIAIDDLIKKEGSFRETLSHGWLSSEILTETLAKFTGDLTEEQLKSMGYTQEQIKGILELGKDANDAATKVKTFSQLMDTLKEAAQSGWTQTWEIIVGDFEEAKALFSTVSDVISGILGESAAARNEVLENWKVLGGRTAIIDSIKYSFQAIVGIFKAVSEAASEIFPPVTAEKLVAISERLRDVAKAFDAFFHTYEEDAEGNLIQKTTKNFENLKRTLKGIFAVVDIVRQIFSAFFKAIGKVLGASDELGGGILAVTAVIGDWLVSFRDAITYSKIFENVFVGIANIVKTAIQWFGNLGRVIGESFIFDVITEGLRVMIGLLVSAGDNTQKLSEYARSVSDAWVNSGFYKFLMGVWNILKTIGSSIASAFGGIFKELGMAFRYGDFDTIFKIFNMFLSGALGVAVFNIVKSISDFFKLPGKFLDVFSGIGESVSDVLDGVGDTLSAFQQKIKADALLSIAKSVGIIAASLILLTLIDKDKLEQAMAAILVLMTVMTIMMKAITMGETAGSISKNGIDFSRQSNGMIGLAVALLAAGIALTMVSKLDWEGIGKGIVGITGVLTSLIVAQLLLAKYGSTDKSVKQGAKAIRTMAVAILIIAIPLKIIGTMPLEQMLQGTIGVIAILGALAVVAGRFGKIGANGGAKGMLVGAACIAIIAATLNMILPTFLLMSLIPFPLVLQGCIGVIGILGTLAMLPKAFGKIADGWKSMLAGTAAVLALGIALKLITPTLLLMCIIPFPALLQGIVGMAAVITALGIIPIALAKIANGYKEILAGSLAIFTMAVALDMIAPVLLMLGLMSWNQALQGVLSVGAVLAAMALTVAAFKKFGGGTLNILATSKAIVTMAGAIMLLAPALVLLGSMSVGQAAVAVGTLAVSLGLLIGTVILIQKLKLVPTLAAFSSAITAIGLGMLAAGGGLVLFGVGLQFIAAGILALVPALTAFVGAMGVVTVGIVALVAAVIEGIIVGLGKGIVAFCQVLVDALPLIADALIELVQALADVVVQCVPTIVSAFFAFILGVLESLKQYIPPIVKAILDLISGILYACADALPELGDSIGKFLNALLQAIVDALAQIDPKVLADAMLGIGIIAVIMAELALMKILAKPAMLGALAMGAVVLEVAGVLSILGLFSGMSGAVEKGGELLEAIGKAFGKFFNGFAKGATEDLPEFATSLSKFAENIAGFLSKSDSVVGGLTGMTDVLKAIPREGRLERIEVLSKELPKLGEGLAAFSDKLGNRSFGNISSAADDLMHIVDIVEVIPKEKRMRQIDQFATDISKLADGLVGFSNKLGEATDPTFSNIDYATTALASIANMSQSIPETGGLRGIIDGNIDIEAFGTSLVSLGKGVADFANETKDIGDISNATAATKAVVKIVNEIPKMGNSLSSILGGKIDIDEFSKSLVNFGKGVAGFATEVNSIEDTTKIDAAVKAASSLVDLTNKIPNEGGMKAWFTGDSALSNYSSELGELGLGIALFASYTSAVDPAILESSVSAASKLAEMTSIIPNTGGVKAWFAGESAISKYATEIAMLGTGISEFSENTKNINIDTVEPAAAAAERLAEMTSHIPNEGGVKAWFSGEIAISKFARDLGNLGSGINKFATNVGDVDLTRVGEATLAAENLAKMTSVIPAEGGMKAWFAGEVSVANFADKLPALGRGIAGFGKALDGVVLDGVDKAALAGQAIADMTTHIPNEGGMKAWFTGDKAFVKFAEYLPSLGQAIASFAIAVSKTSLENVPTAADAAKTLAEMTNTLPNKSDKIVKFGENLGKFGNKMSEFIAGTSHMNSDSLAGANAIVNLAKEASTIDASNVKNVANEIDNLADSVKKMESSVKEDMKSAGSNAIDGYITGINEKLEDAKTAAGEIVTASAETISDKSSDFFGAAYYVVKGFADGIGEYTYIATDAANAMASAVLEEIQSVMLINSPSKATQELGQYGGIGFVNG